MASPPEEKQRPARFLLDGHVVEAADASPTTTLLQYLRGPLGRCGTKEGCAEGDCGACTVVVGEPHGEGMRYRAVNSCIRFVPTLDGKEVVTVESLRAPDGTLHPVQQALVEAHASQCGFCTPGFVMSLFALWLEREAVTREAAVEALSGNLCRCTGYRPILDAAMRMHGLGPSTHWPKGTEHDARRRAQVPVDPQPVRTPGYFAPRTIAALAQAYLEAPDSLLLAGGTDVGLWVTKQLRDLPPILYLGDVAELDRIVEKDGALEIGAAASLTDGYGAIVARYPMLAELAERFGSPPVRNSGTLCGNVANGSPIGDSMPVLIALGSEVVLRRGEQERVLPMEALYLGYRKSAMQPGEFVRAVRVPLPRADRHVATYKISKRRDQDISAVCAAFAFTLRGGNVEEARIAYGGMAATPKRAAAAEDALRGKPWSATSVRAAIEALARDFAPIDDMRASAAYRQRMAGALLERFHAQTTGASA
ncbi:xanthine dehydrogenase small subunit [Betaproteobacteria bacterium GR16-43]|nr:xanthine dehydrogenase small subunit [Betaproteobacteria bacterium GR16-43]